MEDASSPPTQDQDSGPDQESPSKREPRRARRQGESGGPDRDTSDAATQLLRFFHHASDKATTDRDNDGAQQLSPAPPFFGDLNPEGIFIEATMPPAQKTSQTDTDPGHQVIGFVPPASPRQSRGSFAQERRTGSHGTPTLPNETPGPFFTIPRDDGTRFTIPVQDTAKFAVFVQTLVNRELADKVIPSDTDWQTMRDLYLAKIHPIFPIYDKSTLTDLPKETGLRELIQASVCLAASTDPEVHSLLRFKSSPEQPINSQATVSFDDYSREVATFITRRLTELQEGQQIPLTHQIQVMAVTCLYWQPTGPAERFEPLNLYGKLVSLVHTHGVHLGVLARTPAEGGAGASGSRIFKCLYALDRLLGTISARPLMFHNIDLIEVPRPDTQDPPIFRLFIALILLLDQVIELYRPQPKVHYIDIPVYERMALEAGAQHEPESLLGMSLNALSLCILLHLLIVASSYAGGSLSCDRGTLRSHATAPVPQRSRVRHPHLPPYAAPAAKQRERAEIALHGSHS